MKLLENLSEEKYRKFTESRPELCFMQSFEWGKFNETAREQIPRYIGLEDDTGNIVATALLMQKKTPLGMSYFYSPRGFVADYKNADLLKAWTEELQLFLKRENAIYLKIDPELKYHTINENGNACEGENNYDVFSTLTDLGWKHQGFNKLFEHNQPRYTFRIPLKGKDFSEIENNMSKSFMKTVKRSYLYDIQISVSDDIKTFYDLIKLISTKDDFSEYSYNYYQRQFDIFNNVGHIKMHSARIYPDILISKIDHEIKNSDNKLHPEQMERLKKDLDYFIELKGKYPTGKVIGSIITISTDHGVWALYIGNDEIAKYTHTINRLYYESIKASHENGYEFYDLFGTVGDANTSYKNLAGIHDFKRKFGGEYIEFIGEFDLVNKPFWYMLLPKMLWAYRKITRKKY